MKKLGWRHLFLVGLLSFGSLAFAMDFEDFLGIIEQVNGEQLRPRPPHPGRPDRPGRPGRGDVQCVSRDRGWEEHFSGHRSCGECLAEHGRCIETCERTERFISCTFDGVRSDGRRIPFDGTGYDRRAAEMEAENRCYRAGFSDCRYVRCDVKTQREEILRRECRR